RLVGGEAGADRGDLEQHPARLPEVDRIEVVAVLDVGDEPAGVGDAPLPGEVVGVGRRPGDVVDGAGAGHAAVGGLIEGPAHAAPVAVEAVPALPEVRETQG